MLIQPDIKTQSDVSPRPVERAGVIVEMEYRTFFVLAVAAMLCGIRGSSNGLSEDLQCSASNMPHTLSCSASGPKYRHFQLLWRTSSVEDFTSVVRGITTSEGSLRKTSVLHINTPVRASSVECYWCLLSGKNDAGEGDIMATSRKVCVFGSDLTTPSTCGQNVPVAEFNVFHPSPSHLRREAVRVIRQAVQASLDFNSSSVAVTTIMPQSTTPETELLSTSQQNTLPASSTIITTIITSSVTAVVNTDTVIADMPTVSNEAIATSITTVVIPTTPSPSSSEEVRPSQATPTTSMPTIDLLLPTPIPTPGDSNNMDSRAPPTSSLSLSLLSPSTEAGTPSQSGTVEGGLLAAIALCVVFITAIIFIFLTTAIIHICRNKCGHCRKKKEEDLQRIRNGHANRSQVLPIAVRTRPDYADHTSLDADHTSLDGPTSPRQQRPSLTASEHFAPLPALPPQYQRRESAPPEVPPKPFHQMDLPSQRGNYGGMKSPPNYPPPMLAPPRSVSGQVRPLPPDQEVEEVDFDLQPPPPVPKRTTSREHLYHTLEYSNSDHTHTEGVVSPPFNRRESQAGSGGGSYAGSQAGSGSGSQVLPVAVDDDSVEKGRLETASPSFMAEHIRELFDDPRYAMVVIEGYPDNSAGEREGGLTGKKEMSRSTPSLAATGLTGREGTDRRSLRFNHQVVVNRGRLIYS